MKKNLVSFLFPIFGLFGCSNVIEEVDSNPISVNDEAKVLLTYFSRADENYNVGYADKGNTEWLADFIGEKINVDNIFKIERVDPYPSSYSECTSEAKREQNDNARPKIKGNINSFIDYDVIFLGYPIWWGDIPMPVHTFIESYKWDGKIVIPFSTHEGSGWGNSLSTLSKKINGATIKMGYNCRGSDAKNNKKAVDGWLDSLGF